MTAYLLTNHLLNFIAPAAFVALALVLLARIFARIFRSKSPLVSGLWAQLATIFIANLLVLAIGLVFFRADGKMASYASLVLAAAACQWVLWRGWKA